MKKYKVSEGFIKEAYEAACEKWKGKIKKEFPELFEVKLEVGKWYFYEENSEVFIFQRVKEKSELVYGWFNGAWFDKEQDTWYWGDKTSVRLATKEEIETMLWKEGEKRGIGKDTKIEKCLWHIDNHEVYNKGKMTCYYSITSDELWNKNGCIYIKGKWATPLNENKEIQDKIDSLQKQLDELKLKVK